MKMSEQTFCCDECFSYLGKKSSEAAKLWLDLCQMQATGNAMLGVGVEFNALRLLETERFLVSHETAHWIFIRVKGLKKEHGIVYFCGGKCDE